MNDSETQDNKPLNQENVLKKNTADINIKGLLNHNKNKFNPHSLESSIVAGLDYNEKTRAFNLGNKAYRGLSITLDDKFALAFTDSNLVKIDLEKKTSEIIHESTGNYAILYMEVLDQENLITISRGGNVRTFDYNQKTPGPTSTNKVIDKASAATLTSDKNYMVIANTDTDDIEIMSVSERRIIRKRLRAHVNPIYALEVTSDNKYIVSGCDARFIKIWEFEGAMNLVHEFVGAHPGGVTTLKISKDSKIMVSACTDSTINIWDFEKKEKIHSILNAHEKNLESLSISSDGELLFSASRDGTIKLWNIPNKVYLHTFKTLNNEELWCTVTSKNGRYTIAAGDFGAVLLVDLGSLQDKCISKNAHARLIDDLLMTPNGKCIISGGDDGIVKVWDTEKREKMFEMSKPDNRFWKMAVCCDSDRVATGCENGEVDLWSLEKKEKLVTCEEKHTFDLNCVKFTKDGTKLLSCAEEDGLWIRDAYTLKVLDKIIDPRENDLFIIDTTSDDKYYVSGSRYKSIAIWDAQEKKISARIENAHHGSIWALKITSDDKLIISGASDAKTKVWDFQTRRLVYTLNSQHKASIRGLDVSRDDMFVITTGDDAYIEVHNLQLKQRILTYSQQRVKGERSLGAAISNDNQHFFFSTYRSLFMLDNPMGKLTVQSTDEVLKYPLIDPMPLTSFFSNINTDHRKNLIKSYPELQLYPYGWSWFHIVCIFSPQKELVQACVENNIPFKIDIYKKTPFHYLIENKDSQTASISLVLARFDKILQNSHQPFDLMGTLANILPDTIKLDNVYVLGFLKCCFIDPESLNGPLIDTYGRIKDDKKYSVYFSDSAYYSSKVKSNLIEEDNREKVGIKIVPFGLNYSLTSDFTRDLIKALQTITKQEILGDKLLTILIEYYWNSAKNYHYVLKTLFSMHTVLISVYTALGEHRLDFELLIFMTSTFFLACNLLKIVSDGQQCLNKLSSKVNIIIDFLAPVTLIASWSGLNTEMKNWLFCLVLISTYVKWLSYFRVFRQKSKFIKIMIEILKDIKNLGLFLSLFLLGFSLIYSQADGESTKQLIDFKAPIFSSVGFGVFVSQAKVLYFLIIMIILLIVLLNMLIASLEDKFAQTQAKTIVAENKEFLEPIEEVIRIYRGLRKLLLSNKIIETSELEAKKYLYFAEKLDDEQFDENSDQHSIQKQVLKLSEEFSNFPKVMMSVQEPLDIQIRKLTSIQEPLGNRVNKLEEYVEYALDSFKRCLDDRMDEVEKKSEYNLASINQSLEERIQELEEKTLATLVSIQKDIALIKNDNQ